MNTNFINRKLFAETSRIILGCVFVFSGLVKSVDVYGTAYKVTEYLSSFHLSAISELATPISFFLCGFEFFLGLVLLLGTMIKLTSRLALITMSFMTLLTLYIAVFDPVGDCGCFGDAFVLSNWQTFYKNILLLAAAICLTAYSNKITPLFNRRMQLISSIWLAIAISVFLAYNYLYDPVLDFRPFHVGANIPEKMEIDEDKAQITELTYIYEKDGVRQNFSEKDIPWQDSTWIYVDTQEKIVRPGLTEPEIPVFEIERIDFDEDNKVIGRSDVTDDVLDDDGYIFLLIAPSLTELDDEGIAGINMAAEYAQKNNVPVYFMTSSNEDDLLKVKERLSSNLILSFGDGIVLKTIVRSHPGLLILKEGTILAKWSRRSMPDKERYNMSLTALIAQSPASPDMTKLAIFIIVLMAPLIGLKIYEYKTKR